MPRQRRPTAAQSQDLARRFLQLDADIRLAAAAEGLFPFQKERPESPAQTYPYDAELHHPKPKPANGPIKIKQLERVAKSKPSLKTRSVSDPGDAHRLISRFVNDKPRSMTCQSSPPASPSARAFPFPSMAVRKGPQLEMESTADELQDDPLATKMGQILARRAAAATRAISSRRSSLASGRRSVDSNGRRSIDSGRKSRLRIESLLRDVGEKAEVARKRDSALLVPPPVVVDDRSPQEDSTRFWPRAPKSKGIIVGGVGTAHPQPPSADESLDTFTFPVFPQSPEQSFTSQPQPTSHFGSQPPSHFSPAYQLSIQTQLPLTVQTQLDQASPVMFQEDARSVSFVMQASPTSGVYVSPVASPTSLRFTTSIDGSSVAFESSFEGPVEFEGVARQSVYDDAMTSLDPVTTSPRAQRSPTTTRIHTSPATMRIQTSPNAARVQSSPTTMRVQASPTAMRVQASRASVQSSPIAMRIQTYQQSPRFQQSPSSARFQNSPSAARVQSSPTAPRFQQASTSRIPVARQTPVSDARYHSSPTTVYSQASPATPSGIPVRTPATPMRSAGTPRANGTPIQRPPSEAHLHLLRGLSPLPSHGLPLPAPVRHPLNRRSLLGDVFAGNPMTDPQALNHDPTSPEEPSLAQTDPSESIRQWTPPPPSTPPPHVNNVFSTPNAASTPVASRILSTSPAVLPPNPPSPSPAPPPPAPIPAFSSTRTLSPIPARLRPTPDAGSASDEVVFRGSSSTTSTPQKRKYRRSRFPARAHSDGSIQVPNESSGRARTGSGSVRRTAQSLMRRGQAGDGGEVSSDGRDVVLFVPRSMGPPSRAPSPTKPLSRTPSPVKMSPSKLPQTSPSKLPQMSPSKLPQASPSKIPVRIGSPQKPSSRAGSPTKPNRPIPPPLVRRASIPLPESSPTRQAPPPGLGLLGAELLMVSSQELPRRPSIELREPIIVPPRQSQSLAHMPWSPPRHVLSRMETASREGSFHTAMDSPALMSDDLPGSFPLVGTPAPMDEERESTTVHSAVTAEENPLVQSAVRGMVSRPVTMTFARRPSGEFASRPSSANPARQTATPHSFLAPPASLAPSPSFPGPSHTPNSSSIGGSSNHHMASIPVRRDQHYSPPGSLPESVTPPTDLSRPPTERSNSHLEDETFYSVHASDSDIRLPVENWIAFTMGNMDANGLPITRETFDEFQSSEDEGLAVAEVLSMGSARRPDSAIALDEILPHDDDNDSGESAGQSLSDVGTTPSPSRSGSRHSGWVIPPAAVGLTVRTSDLDYPEDDGNISAFSNNTDTSESNRLTVDQLQSVASIVHELNGRTPIPSASSSHLRSPPSVATTSAAYVTPPSFIPYRASHSAPSRTFSPGAVSITFSEASPSLSTIPPPSLMVSSENRNRFADNLVLGGYGRPPHYLRDDDQRALEEGEDVILYGGDWEHVGRRSESRATTSSAIPVEIPTDFDPTNADIHSRNKYLQFLLSFAGALRHQAPPQRMVESALRTLRRQPSHPAPRYPADLYDEIGRDEVGLVSLPPQIPSHPVSSASLSSSSSDIGSALPDDDEIVEDFVRSIMTPHPGTPHRPPPPIIIQEANVLPWPALPSPVSPRIRFARSVSRQTTRSQATSLTRQSGYSSLIPPPPRPRPRSIEPHWLTVYVAHRWPVPDTYVTRRTYSSPSALGPPMPYLWRPICHITPERLWEITNFEAQAAIPPPMPPPPALSPPPNTRQHFSTPATTQNHATYSMSSVTTTSTSSSRSNMMLPPDIYPDVGFVTSHANLQIDSLSALPPLPPSVPTLMERQMSNSTIPRNHLGSRLSLGSSVGSSNHPSSRPRQPSTRIVTPVAATRKHALKDLVGKIVGRRARTRSIHSRASSPYVPKPKFGVAGKVVEVTRRIFRRGRRARLSSIRSQAPRAAPET